MSGAVHGIILVGPSGAGKSTILDALREHLRHDGEVLFPARLITRPARADDRSWENAFVSVPQLDALEAAGRVMLRWQKPIASDQIIHYAYLNQQGKFFVLGGNSALILHQDRIRPSARLLTQFAKILISAPREVRESRLAQRSPELRARHSEWQYRLQDNDADLRPRVDHVIDTSTTSVANSVEILLDVIRSARG